MPSGVVTLLLLAPVLVSVMNACFMGGGISPLAKPQPVEPVDFLFLSAS